MEAVAKDGPIAVSVDATDWWMYGGGTSFLAGHDSRPGIRQTLSGSAVFERLNLGGSDAVR